MVFKRLIYPQTVVRKALREVTRRFWRWWHIEAHDLANPDLTQMPAITMFYSEIGELAKQIGLSEKNPRPEPNRPDGWAKLPNLTVLETLRAGSKLASNKPAEIKEGIDLLKREVERAERLIESQAEPGRRAVFLTAREDSQIEETLNGARHLRRYFLTATALLHVRLGLAYLRLTDANAGAGSNEDKTKAFEAAGVHFAAARDLQPDMRYIAQEQARYFARQGEFEQAERALRGTGPIVTRASLIDYATARAAVALDFFAGARAYGKLPELILLLEGVKADLDSIRKERGIRLSVDQDLALMRAGRDVMAIRGFALSELGDHAGAFQAFAESHTACGTNPNFALDALALTEKRGDEQVQMNDLGKAAEYYGRRKRVDDPEAAPIHKRMAAKQVLARMLAEDEKPLAARTSASGSVLDRYVRKFAGKWPGPFYGLTIETDSLLSRPGAQARLRLVLDRRRRAKPSTGEALDLRSAIVRLIASIWSDTKPEAAPPPDEQPIRLEIDPALFVPVDDPNTYVEKRLGEARDRVEKEWGIRFPAVRGVDGPPGEYRVFCREKPLGQGPALPGASNSIRPSAGELPIDRVFVAVEECIATNLWLMFGFAELRQLMARNGNVASDTDTAPAEVKSVVSMVPLLLFVRDLLIQRIRLADFRPIYDLWRKRSAREPGQTIVEAVRQMPGVRKNLWGTEPGRRLFRISKNEAARLGKAITGPAGAARDWGRQTLEALARSVQPNATLILPDASFRCAMQRLITDVPVLVSNELPLASLAGATVLEVSDGPPTAVPSSPPPGPRSPPGAPPAAAPAAPNVVVVVQDAIKGRGLTEAVAASVSADVVAAAQRHENLDYAMELALDEFGPDHIKIRASAPALARLESWVASGGPDSLRRDLYRSSGIWLPPIRIDLDDDIGPDGWTIGFNGFSEQMPQAPGAIEQPAIAFLLRNLAAFVGNHQVEFLLSRLNQIDPVLVLNLLEKYAMPDIIQIIRELIAAGKSVRDLKTIAEELVLNATDMTALDPATRIEILSKVAPPIAGPAGP
jgi:tetratricopeptide (TPR) repeat protein